MNQKHPLQKVLLVCASAALAAPASTQSLYTINGAFATISEQTASPSGQCPNGPYLGGFSTIAPFPCGTVGTFPGPSPTALGGDIAVARTQNLIYATDGTNITLYSTNGSPSRNFTLASGLPTFGTITGLGYDDVAGLLWVCNATTAVGITPPGPSNCPSSFVIGVPPFPLLAVGAPYTDIEWDPVTSSLFACTAATGAFPNGLIANVLPGGLPGFYGVIAPPVTCATGGMYGLAMEHSYFAGPAAMYVTNGSMIERITPWAGAPAATFYSPVTCFAATSTTSGLASSAHAIGYGLVSGPDLAFLSGSGQSVSPNPAFALNMSTPPGAFAFLFLSTGSYLCPGLGFGGGLLLYLDQPALVVQGLVPPSGVITFPVPIPNLGIGFPASTFFLQGFVFSTNGFSATHGLALSIARP